MHAWSALIIGLLGSLHCLGMCGPLAIALPGVGRHGADFLLGRILYNAGRIATYCMLGVLFGLLGQSLVLVGLQQWVSIGAGLAILAYLLLRGVRPVADAATTFVAGAVVRLKSGLAGLLDVHSPGALLLIGLLNGLLPCGLVYVALAGAAASGTAAGGFTYMLLFGAGTIPVMLTLSLGGSFVQGTFRARLNQAIPYALGVLAVLFVLRGMSLGIPYVSPDLAAGGGGCCH
jgi:sulfite exporter TauE/SafE